MMSGHRGRTVKGRSLTSNRQKAHKHTRIDGRGAPDADKKFSTGGHFSATAGTSRKI